MFPVGATRRLEDDPAIVEGSPHAPHSCRFAEVVWVHDGPVCVTIVEEPRRDFHGNTCRCGACRTALPPDDAITFL
jgi:hypothetical protein